MVDANPGPSPADGYPSDYYVYKNKLYFGVDDGGNFSQELWVTDGDVTKLFYDSAPGSGWGGARNLIEYHGYLYFSANIDGHSMELCRSDGTVAGSGLFKITDPSRYYGGDPSKFYIHNDTLFFNSWSVLWKSDGTYSGTVSVGSPAGYPHSFCTYNNLMYFGAVTASTGAELYVYDGVTDTVTLAVDINPGPNPSYAQEMIVFNNWMYFSATDGVNGQEFMRSNGTYTELVKDINVGAGNSDPKYFKIFQNKLYFQADDGTSGTELWVSDGSTVGTVLLMDIRSGNGGSNPRNFVILNNILYFGADDGINGRELWSTDGTLANTKMVIEISKGSTSSEVYGLTVYNNALYFSAEQSSTGNEIWKYTPGHPLYP